MCFLYTNREIKLPHIIVEPSLDYKFTIFTIYNLNLNLFNNLSIQEGPNFISLISDISCSLKKINEYRLQFIEIRLVAKYNENTQLYDIIPDSSYISLNSNLTNQNVKLKLLFTHKLCLKYDGKKLVLQNPLFFNGFLDDTWGKTAFISLNIGYSANQNKNNLELNISQDDSDTKIKYIEIDPDKPISKIQLIKTFIHKNKKTY